jgi:leader peptidase (prepilin peptidase)/N-methyltransferase
MTLIAPIPAELQVLSVFFAFVLGAIVGSFLNVYIYRFHTGKSLGGSSHCLSCGVFLRWYELVPIISYVCIFGRCRHCQARVPIRYFVVELLTASLFALALTLTPFVVGVVLWWIMLSVLVVILIYDYYHFIIPDVLTATLTGVAILWSIFSVLVLRSTWSVVGFDVLAATLGATFFWFLWKLSKGQWLGFGDVKLAWPLGFLVGSKLVFSYIVVSFWIGAVVSVGLLLITRLQRGKSYRRFLSTPFTMKSVVPFAPFLIAGALVTIFTDFNVLTFFAFRF